jgi:esterase/lipase superfamily enzyme
MLHGLGGDHTQWMRTGLLATATDLMQRGEIAPFIIVLPDGERGYWVDHANNGPRFGSYVSRDLVATVDRDYRTLAARDSRAIGGMSMGGHGALQLALNNPETFRVVGAHSVALRDKDQAFEFFGDQQYFQAHDPVSLVQSRADVARQLVISVDIGTTDPWKDAADAFHGKLQSSGLVHLWSVDAGGHDDAYWAAHVPSTCAGSLHRAPHRQSGPVRRLSDGRGGISGSCWQRRRAQDAATAFGAAPARGSGGAAAAVSGSNRRRSCRAAGRGRPWSVSPGASLVTCADFQSAPLGAPWVEMPHRVSPAGTNQRPQRYPSLHAARTGRRPSWRVAWVASRRGRALVRRGHQALIIGAEGEDGYWWTRQVVGLGLSPAQDLVSEQTLTRTIRRPPRAPPGNSGGHGAVQLR